MSIHIKEKDLVSIILKLKEQFFYVDIMTSGKGWTGEYYVIEEIKHLECSIGNVPILIAKSVVTGEWKVFPLEVIEGMRLNKLYDHFDHLANEFRIDSIDILEPTLMYE
ncbi:MAG: hypothetical protein ABIS36_02690 [Chryseolinea sp.]